MLLFSQRRNNLVLGFGHRTRALLLVGNRISGAHLVFAGGLHGCGQRGVILWLEVKRLFCAIFGQINDQVDDWLDAVVGEFHRAKHFSLGQLICFGFNHHHGVFCAGNNKVETLLRLKTQVMHVVDFRVQDVFTTLKTHGLRS